MLIEARDATDPVVRQLVTEQQAELAADLADGFLGYPVRTEIEFVVGLIDGRPVGCGGLQRITQEIGEIKRMYVRPAHRGRGLSRLILAALEERAVQRGYRSLRLETGRDLTAAIGLYRAAGFRPIPLYGEYEGSTHSLCFGKPLVPAEVPSA